MQKLREKNFYLLLLAALVIIASIPLLQLTAESKEYDYYKEQITAAEKMLQLIEAVKQLRSEQGLPFNEEDRHQTGLIGQRYTGITTTLGDVAAKRTVCQPDMAAMLVRMLVEAGIKEGDTVAASMTGSFPGLNLAFFAASDALKLKLRYISSIGASMYGANEEDLTFPEIAYYLYRDNLISNPALAISMGGDRDMGDEMLEVSREKVRRRVQKLPIFYLEEGDFSKNLTKRRELFEKDSEVDAFVSIGGHTSSLGHDEKSLELGQGILLAKGERTSNLQAWKIKQSDKTGLLQYYLSREIAVINLLNIRRIVSDYGLPFDPMQIEQEIGVSPVYYHKTYNLSIIYIVLLLVLSLLVSYAVLQKNTINKHKSR
ncbi:MAG: poly-gamma-glutamate system protein [Eubacteriales bacterium]|nr:poly-gamma-glutamate system protein [Eubacteriales bacterium]